MQNLFKSLAVALLAIFLLSACAISPRSSDWTSPKKFTQAQVFNAAVSAGGEMGGYSATSVDRSAYNLTLTRPFADKKMTVTVHVRDQGGNIHVNAFAIFNDIAISGVYEETIKNFHVALFRNLNIDQSEMSNVVIQEAK